MTPGPSQLFIAAIAWMAMHLVVSGTPLRGWIVQAIGEGAFRAVFSVASAVVLAWLIWSYSAAGPIQSLWVTPRWVIVLCMLLMLPALVLFVGSVTTPNPTMVQGQRALKAENPARGILRVTRHPMLWSFALWAGVHLVMLGTLGATVFFATFLIVAIAGMPSLDAKISKRGYIGWADYAQATSIIPFAAIAQGRNQFRVSEIGAWRITIAVVAWFALIAGHQWLFHISMWRFL
jgi:uncharacterized membrane protein